MKNIYVVEFIKSIQYKVEAENFDEAECIAIDLDCDKEAEIKWATNPYTEIIIEKE